MMTIKKDLRARFVGARDQGPRPTCLAFAVSDAHAAERPPHRSLSADFLYYHALRRMSANHGDNGVGLKQATDAVRVDGQPIETAWPYSRTLPADLMKWKPPGKLAVMMATGTSNPASVDSVCAKLDQDQPSVLIFRPSERFYYADTAGLLPARSTDSDLPASHAVVAVGYGVTAARRHVLIRNSWGTNWGQHGHAWLAEDYLAPRLSSVTSIQAN
jgi:hypothetical protein